MTKTLTYLKFVLKSNDLTEKARFIELSVLINDRKKNLVLNLYFSLIIRKIVDNMRNFPKNIYFKVLCIQIVVLMPKSYIKY